VNKRHLRWATPVENMADTLVHGTRNRGERHGIAKLTEDDVRIIRQMIASGHRQRMIAEKFGVQVMAISNINRRVTWGWFE
jgi:DNA invertase Pin-like site-specific DNA recombinase